MKIFHISDLHIGKQLHLYDLYEDQQYILNQIMEHIKRQQPEVLLICGDIYDKSIPAAKAYQLFDQFLNQLQSLSITTLIIAGNHDSRERLSYAASFLEKQSIYVRTYLPADLTDQAAMKQALTPIRIEDEYGPVSFYLLPFIKPALFFDQTIHSSYQQYFEKLLDGLTVNYRERNVLLAHQFFTYLNQQPEISDSEQTSICVGGLDNINAQLVEAFDYVALGHLHRSQQIGQEHIRYCGSPLKYSISEANNQKSITQITLRAKTEQVTERTIETIPLTPLRDVLALRGTVDELIEQATTINAQAYVSLTITEDSSLEAKNKLNEVYPNILTIKFYNQQTQALLEQRPERAIELDPFHLFVDFYQTVMGQKLNLEEANYVQAKIKQARGVDHETN